MSSSLPLRYSRPNAPKEITSRRLIRAAFSAYLTKGYVAADFAPAEEGGRRRKLACCAPRVGHIDAWH